MSENILSKKKVILGAVILATIAAASGMFMYTSASGINLSGNITVTVVADPVYIASVSITPSASCSLPTPLQTLQTFSCNLTSLEYGTNMTIAVTLANPVTDQTVSITPSMTSATNILTVVPYSSNVVQIQTGANYTFTFTATATQLGQGSLAISFTG